MHIGGVDANKPTKNPKIIVTGNDDFWFGGWEWEWEWEWEWPWSSLRHHWLAGYRECHIVHTIVQCDTAGKGRWLTMVREDDQSRTRLF